jgi:hypothetical protein
MYIALIKKKQKRTRYHLYVQNCQYIYNFKKLKLKQKLWLTEKSVGLSSVTGSSSLATTGQTFSAPKLESRTVEIWGCRLFCRLLHLDDEVDDDDEENFFDGSVEYFTLMSLDVSFQFFSDVWSLLSQFFSDVWSLLSQFFSYDLSFHESSSKRRLAGPLNDDRYSATVASVDDEAWNENLRVYNFREFHYISQFLWVLFFVLARATSHLPVILNKF